MRFQFAGIPFGKASHVSRSVVEFSGRCFGGVAVSLDPGVNLDVANIGHKKTREPACDCSQSQVPALFAGDKL